MTVLHLPCRTTGPVEGVERLASLTGLGAWGSGSPGAQGEFVRGPKRVRCGMYDNRKNVLQYLLSKSLPRGRIQTGGSSGDNGQVGVDELAVLCHLGR